MATPVAAARTAARIAALAAVVVERAGAMHAGPATARPQTPPAGPRASGDG